MTADATAAARDPGRYRYGIDAADLIRFVDDAWLEFARDNDAPELTREAVLDRPIWDYVTDLTTRHLYRILFDTARATGRVVRFPFRCDSPGRRREMRLSIHPREDGGLDLDSRLVAGRPRTPQALLRRSEPRSDSLLRICGWCKRIPLPGGEWVELEEATSRLDLFGSERLPRLSHGLCPDCDRRVRAEIESL